MNSHKQTHKSHLHRQDIFGVKFNSNVLSIFLQYPDNDYAGLSAASGWVTIGNVPKHRSSIRVGCWDWHIQYYMGLWIKDAAICKPVISWWRHQMETFSALLALRAGNSPVPGEFPAQRPGTRSFDVFFDLRPNKRLSKQSWGNNFNDNFLKVSDHDRINLISFYGLWLMTSHHWLRKSLGAENFSLMWCNKQL